MKSLTYASIASGSCGNCHYISSKDTSILIDAGLSGKKIETNFKNLDIEIEKIKAIFITHEHKDHILGAGILSRRYNIPIYANEKTWQSMQKDLGKIKDENMKVLESGKKLDLDEMQITSFKINHDASDPVGYKIEYKNKSASIATDTGKIDDDMKKIIKGSNLVVLESNHDVEMLKMGSYPYYLKRRVLSNIGHLSNEHAADFCVELVKSGTKQILLAHLSKENNFPELAYETVKGILKMQGIEAQRDVLLNVLKRQLPFGLCDV